VKVRRMADGSVLYYDPRGAWQSFELGRGAVLHVAQGIGLTEFARLAIEDGERQFEKFGRCIYMVDAFHLKMATTECREELTRWLKANRSRVVAHILVKSKLVEMTISVMNLLVGMSTHTIYSNVAQWESAGRKELGQFQRRELVIPDDLKGTAA